MQNAATVEATEQAKLPGGSAVREGIAGTFVPSSAKKKTGDRPAAILIGAPQTEAAALAKKGVASLVVAAPQTAPATAAAFRSEVARLDAALKELAGRPGVDTRRLAVVAHGVGAHVAAALAAQEPTIRAIVLRNVEVAEAAGRSPSEWVTRGAGAVLLQLDAAHAQFDENERQKILQEAPPGTLERAYAKPSDPLMLSDSATWLADELDA